MPQWLIPALAAAAIAAGPVIAQSPETPEFQPGDELIGREPFPAIFHGVWATTFADCDGYRPEMIEITAELFSAHESRSVLLRSGGVVQQTAPDGRPAFVMNARVASSSEGEDSVGPLRLIRVGDILYTSNPEVVSEAEQYSYPWIRCPANPR